MLYCHDENLFIVVGSPFTVITDDDGRKFPIASYRLTPDIAICDSTLTDLLPKSLIANAGIDAVTHAIESFLSVLQTDFTKQQSIAALELLFQHLPTSYECGTPVSRDAVHRGATLAGIALSNAFVGVCHSLSHTVGAEFHLPHGMANGILLPHVIRYNATESPTKMCAYPSYTHPKAGKQYSEIARAIGASEPTPDGLIDEFMKLLNKLELPVSFQDAGVDRAQFFSKLTVMAENAFDDQCTPANPRFPLVEELQEILRKAYDGDMSAADPMEPVPITSPKM
jgi:acetaldehyde dehydrogenase/alcohol dehydrogenase